MNQSKRIISMGKTFLLLLFMVLLWHGTGQCNAPQQVTANYASLLAQLKSGDTALDYAALRTAYTKSGDYNPYDNLGEARKAMLLAITSQDFKAAATHAQTILLKNYLDMEAHYFSTVAYRELKNSERQKYHATVLKGLISALYASGDGQTLETAYTVINVDEEYFVLRINGYKVIRQKLLQKDGIHFDAMEVEPGIREEEYGLF